MSDVKIQRVEKVEDRTLPVFRETEAMLRRIEQRAFDLFAGRGYGHGHALEDWLGAERETCWPATELVEADKEFGLSVTLPGYEPGEIAVTATPRELIVHAQTRAEHKDEARKGGAQLRWSEFRSNDVYRRIELPSAIDVATVTATLKHGLLKIVASKVATPVAKTLRTVPVAAAA
jgi:HSP20 family molecular chaperone IbpA